MTNWKNRIAAAISTPLVAFASVDELQGKPLEGGSRDLCSWYFGTTEGDTGRLDYSLDQGTPN